MTVFYEKYWYLPVKCENPLFSYQNILIDKIHGGQFLIVKNGHLMNRDFQEFSEISGKKFTMKTQHVALLVC